MSFRCIFCSRVNEIGPFCDCIRERYKEKSVTKQDEATKQPDSIFDLADKFGAKKEMIALIKFCLDMHKGTDPMAIKFGPEELFCGIHTGLQDAGVPRNFQFRSRFSLGRAYLFGYLLGRMIMKESENKNYVEAANKS